VQLKFSTLSHDGSGFPKTLLNCWKPTSITAIFVPAPSNPAA